MEIKLIFTRKVVHLASFLKGRVFGTQKWPIILDLLIITFFVTKNPNWVALSSITLQYSSPKRITVGFKLTVAHT